jgi:hypothetical protein
VVVEAVLKAFGWDVKNQLRQGDGIRGGEEAMVVYGCEGREVVAKDTDGPCGVSGGLPSREVFCINWWEFVNFVGVAVGYTLGGISDRSNEGNKESREGCSDVVAEAQASTLEGQLSYERGKGRGGVEVLVMR